jgi:hypothetical protein
MRPNTLSETIDRIVDGEPTETALSEFLDTFHLASSDAARAAMLAAEPRLTGDGRLDALAAATADYLARQNGLPSVPEWAFDRRRFLREPWHVSPLRDDAMLEYLTFASPAEFRSRNIFTEECPLRRARTRGRAGGAGTRP